MNVSRTPADGARAATKPREPATCAYEYTFPAVRGIQAGRAYYVTMLPLRMLGRLFEPGQAQPDPARRSQRQLSKPRIPAIARYITANPASYVLPALTAMADADLRFSPAGESGNDRRIGVLAIPCSARFTLADGQHRVAAIAHALEDDRGPLGMESIPVVLYPDTGLARSQQVFADLNRHAVRPAPSLTILYDQRDQTAAVTRHVLATLPLLAALTDTERTSLPRRSPALFTLSALHAADNALLSEHGDRPLGQRTGLAAAWWDSVAAQFPDWEKTARGELHAAVVREEFIHSSALVLHALARIGSTLIESSPDPATWHPMLTGLRDIDWRRTAPHWEGRAVTGGRLVKSHAHVLLTTAAIRRALSLPLPTAEQEPDEHFRRSRALLRACVVMDVTASWPQPRPTGRADRANTGARCTPATSRDIVGKCLVSWGNLPVTDEALSSPTMQVHGPHTRLVRWRGDQR